jgi:hypothetical protein
MMKSPQGEVRSGFFEGLGLEGSKKHGPDQDEVTGNGIQGNFDRREPHQTSFPHKAAGRHGLRLANSRF